LSSTIRRLIVLDGNAPWVRSLFLAMPTEIEVRIIHVGQPQVFRKLSEQNWLAARRWQSCGPNASERWIIIPGWNKAPRLSTWLTHRAVAAAAGDDAQSTGVVFALPQFAGVAERSTLRPRVYYAHDPFEFYDWDREQTRAMETRMLNGTEATFAISQLLRDDLQARTDRPVFYSPNAVSPDFVHRMRTEDMQSPADLTDISRPIVGCTGQINETYDWPMLAGLVSAMGDVSFIFIGPMAAPSPEVQAQIDGVLKGRKNVHWLGAKPHDQLPNYLRQFDVCLNPLAPGPHADRRSPLRLYDFLATGKPVVSTAIHEVSVHEGQVWMGGNAAEIGAIIRSALSGNRRVDSGARNDYVSRNTWQFRARKLLEMIESIDPKKSGGC
jgi:glycosyltransferase involved in cell wall biosynthesis